MAQEVVDRFQQYVSREYMHPQSLMELARAAGVSRQHLMKLCRQMRLPSPMEYLFQKRLERACEWLAHTGLTIAEISERCGFVNPFHFSRKFKQQYGTRPLQWRKQLWVKPS